ncbi:MAG: damage-control phosphatase ARMT1 family protein [Anaerolineae bacterium]
MPVLPPPIMTSEPGSFAQRTMMKRKPRVVDQVLASNDYPPDVRARLMGLRRELLELPARPPSRDGDDASRWYQAWLPWRGHTWLDLPWYLAESLFYRRLLEAVRYFELGPWYHRDPFALAKAEALAKGLELARGISPTVGDGNQALRTLILRSLWGNQVDLSNNGFDGALLGTGASLGEDHLLVDHTASLVRLLASPKTRTLHMVCDNAGPELLADLGLVHWLLGNGYIERASLHLKAHPFFVSDAMPTDLQRTLQTLRESSTTSLADLGSRLSNWLQSGHLRVLADRFWTGHLGFRHMPSDLVDMLSRADLLLFKGDANYRRLLDDRHWSPTDDLGRIVSYLQVPFAILRTIKAELVVGLPEGVAERTAQMDPQWLVNGQWGLVQLVVNG